MQSSDARLRSFTQKSRFWPHTGDNYKATPGALAEAGFYWKPALSSPDNVVCFLCGKSLDGWTDTDDPFDEHLSHSRHCGWAIIKSIPLLENDQLPFRWDDEDELPKGERMTKARLDTFGNWWPHESEGWYGTTRRMANAGFYYAPTDDSKDNVQCPYCWLGLDGWESNDDPIHEHQRRKPTCPFFATRAAAPTKASAAKATKNKRKETLLVDNRSSNEQSLLLSPKSQRVHTPVAVMDKPSLRKNPRVGRIVKSSTPSPSPFIAEEDSTAETSQQPTTILKSESKKVNSKSSSSSSSSSSSQSVRSTRLVGFDLPDTTTIEPVISTKEPVTRSKAKAAPEKTAEIVKANVSRRGSQRNSSEVEDSEATNNSSQNTELEQSSEANSHSSSTAGRKRQKQQQQESEDDTTSNTSMPRQSTSSTISVVVPKKRRLTKAEQAFNRQQQNEAKSEDDQDKENVIQDPTSVDAPNIENPKDKLKDPAPVGTPIIEDYKDNSDVSSTISVKPRQRRVRKTKKSEIDNDSDQSTQSRDMNESNTSQTVIKRRGRSKKILGEEESLVSVLKSKKVTLRSSKRGPRSAEHLTSPLKKKAPKALIEIFELPDEPDQGQEEPASSTMDMESKLQDSNLISENPTTKEDTTDGMSTETTGLVSTSPRNNDQHAPEPVVTSSHAPSTSPQNMEIVESALEERESTPVNGDEGFLEHPTTPVRRQAVSMQDIENAKVVIVDSTTPARRAASSMDIEGWEDEDRRESTQSRLSSPFISPSKWGLDDSSLTTSTPKAKKLPMEPIPSISQRHKIKDVFGDLRSPSRHAHTDLSHSSHLKSPASKKTPRAEILSPEVKQQKLIDRLDNLMQEDDSSVVLAVAESALKEEVKLLRRSQNKEKKLAAAAAASQSTTRENSEAPEDEDIHMQEPETINTFMQTPVKKAGMSVTFESNLSTTPINNKTPLPISNVISAIGAASRRNHNVAASPFVKTPVKKTVDLIRLEDLEVRGNGTATVESLINEDMSVSKNLPELKSVNPFSVQESTGANQSTSGPDSSKLYWERQRQNQMSRGMETEGDQEQETIPKVLKLHEDSKENERRLRLMKESGLSEAELKMTVEEFHRVILEEQVRRLELAGEAWIQRFQEESDRVRKALLEDFPM